MDTQKTPKTPKTPTKFECLICHFKCSRNAEYLRHLSTSKHLNNAKRYKGYKEDTQKHEKNTGEHFPCENCGKHYKFHSGLWRHKKTCLETNIETTIEKKDEEEVSDKDLIMMLVKQNTELLEIVKNGTHHNTTTHTNSHNKTFNLQFFLNETCKDAMNITDFVETIKIQISDLIKIGEIGYVEGISNIITTSLNAMDVTQRPIHCTDKKREILYVKDEDKWEKENEEKVKLRKAIKTVSSKNIQTLPKFVKEHPDCKNGDSPFSDQYSQILIQSMGNDCDNEDKIIKNIYGQVVIDKDAMTV